MTFPNILEPGFLTDPQADPSLISGLELTPEIAEKFDLIAKNYMERWMEQCWIDDGEFKGWRWEKYNVQRRVAGVANRYGGIIVMGVRHYSNMMRVALDALGGNDLLLQWCGEENYEQGFVDQYGTFLDRKEAWILAEAAGQIRFTKNLPTGELYSEHLW